MDDVSSECYIGPEDAMIPPPFLPPVQIIFCPCQTSKIGFDIYIHWIFERISKMNLYERLSFLMIGRIDDEDASRNS